MSRLRGMCEDQPAAYWNTFNAGNLVAFRLCAICPLPAAGKCGPELEPVGMIVDGVPYDDHGHALERCPSCGYPMPRRKGYRNGACNRKKCPAGAKRSRRQAKAAVDAAKATGKVRRPSMFIAEITELTLAGMSRADIAAELQLNPRGVREVQTKNGLTGARLADTLAHAAATTTTSRKAQ